MKNPWKDVDTQYKIGQRVNGHVRRIVPFGAFIELEDGLNGLLHKSEMSSEGNKSPNSLLKENQELEVEVKSIEAERKRITTLFIMEGMSVDFPARVQ